jgi:p-cymene monooxygenase electron transfer component
MGILSALFGQSVSKVMAQPSGISFEVRRSQSILEAALAQGIAFPHSCTVGTCGSCKCRLLSGKIREITNFAYVLSAEELRANVVLACQAGAKTDVVLDVPGLESKRLHPAGDFTARISDIQDLTHDIKRVILSLDRPLRFDAGQYVQLSVDAIFGARAYSLAMAPAAEGNQTLELFIRRVPEGEFTELLFAGHLLDLPIKVHGPAGNFWLRDSRAPMICIAGGSGLAPLISMLQDAATRQVGRHCVLLFGARSQADLYGREAIEAIAAQWNGAFQFVPVLSDAQSDDTWHGARGLVTEQIAAAAADLIGADTQAYLCGPPPMIDAALPVLSALGIAPQHIHFDKFLDGSHGLARQDLD